MPVVGGVYALDGGNMNQDGPVDSGGIVVVDNGVLLRQTGFLQINVNGDGIMDASE